MKQKYIPLGKRSKREQEAHFSARRGSWGEINPVTKKPPNPKAYIRKKSGKWYEHEPFAGFCFYRTRNLTQRVIVYIFRYSKNDKE